MNILKWLKDKTGKLPITLAQAAGITAVVGAAGFGAMTFLSSSSDTNNSFLPPAHNQGEVVYVAQSAGGGSYESNGEVGSSFNAAPSRTIQLANQQAARQAQTRALEASSQQAPSFAGSDAPAAPQMPQAYQLSGADLGQGLGGGKDKNLNASLDTFSTIQNQLAGVTQAINNAQAGAGGAQATGKPGAPAGQPVADSQNAAQLASAPRNWGNGGLTRAGGGNGGSNSFAIQNSGKNVRTRGASADEMAQAGDAIAQAQAAMAQLQEGGPRMRSQANFGRSEGLTEDKDARIAASRRFGNAKAELDFIRKKSAAIASNRTNAANEGGSPFLSSARISGGLTVNGENVTTGQGSSSGDLGNKFDKQMRGIGARLDQVQANIDERDLARDELKAWLWKMLTAGIAAILAITALVSIAKAGGPFTAWAWGAAGVVTAAALAYIWWKGGKILGNYNGVCGADKWTTLWWALSGIMTGGIGAAWFVFSGKNLGNKIREFFNIQSKTITGAPDAIATQSRAQSAATSVEEIVIPK